MSLFEIMRGPYQLRGIPEFDSSGMCKITSWPQECAFWASATENSRSGIIAQVRGALIESIRSTPARSPPKSSITIASMGFCVEVADAVFAFKQNGQIEKRQMQKNIIFFICLVCVLFGGLFIFVAKKRVVGVY